VVSRTIFLKTNNFRRIRCALLAYVRCGGLALKGLNWWGRQFSWLLAVKVCASALVMLDTPCSEVVWEYWLPTPFASFPFTSPPVHRRVPSGFKRTLPNTPSQPRRHDAVIYKTKAWQPHHDWAEHQVTWLVLSHCPQDQCECLFKCHAHMHAHQP